MRPDTARNPSWRAAHAIEGQDCSHIKIKGVDFFGTTVDFRNCSNVTIEDVGNVAAFLLSDLAAGVTAEITYVDGGFSQVVGGIAEPSA